MNFSVFLLGEKMFLLFYIDIILVLRILKNVYPLLSNIRYNSLIFIRKIILQP